MAQKMTNQSKPNNTSYRVKRSSKNAYKVGKLSKNARFSTRKINYKLIFVLGALVLSFVFAMAFGNHLSKKAEESKNSPPSDSSQNVVIPSADKVSPKVNLNAFYVDFSTALPPTEENSNSLSNQTANARNSGNALFVELVNGAGNLIYSSDLVAELGLAHEENVTLKRLKDHFTYYNDYVVGYFKSGFSASADASNRTKTQSNEILLLTEASNNKFSQFIIEFSSNITKDNLIYYQSYILSLKLACESAPIGIKVPLSFLTSATNHGILAELMRVADFYVIDLGDKSAEQISETLSPFAYFLQEYKAEVIISADEETLNERIDALKYVGVNNYIVK